MIRTGIDVGGTHTASGEALATAVIATAHGVIGIVAANARERKGIASWS